MALVPQDATGLSTADTYVSRSDANTYMVAHGSPAAWTALSDAVDGGREAALRYALRWLDARYSWPGLRFVSTQSTAWPRTGAYSNERGVYIASLSGVPQLVKDAQCEFALAHANAALNAALARGGQIESASLGPMAVKFAQYAPPEAAYPYIDALLSTIGCSVADESSQNRLLSFGVA